jgi:hypothetical protein
MKDFENKNLIGKIVKVYRDTNTKKYYEGDGRIEKVIKQVSWNFFLCDISFEDNYFSCTIDINDILEY